MANFFAYFDPKMRLGSRDILFLICCPSHQSEDVKQKLENAGLTPCEATSRRYLIPRHDKAFVFVSEGIVFARSEDKGGFYLRLVLTLSKAEKFNTVLSNVLTGRDVLVCDVSSLPYVPGMVWGEV